MDERAEKVTPRRAFVRQLGLGAAAVATGATGIARMASAATLDTTPDASPMHGASEQWLTKITGKHKQFFDAVSTNEGWPLGFAMNFLNSNAAAYGLKDSQLTAIVGLRHFAVPMALSDAIWAKYHLGEALHITDKTTNAPAVRNVFANVHAGDLPFPGMSVNELQARGVMFTVCNVALTALSGMLSKGAGTTPAAALSEWTAALLPGMVVVPAGVLAVNRAQERGCTYCYAG